jgi:hypothetical protein
MSKGFQDITIPAQTIRTCFGCDHYQRRLVRSGYNPMYDNHCNHPNMPTLNGSNILDIEINGYVETPNYCPLLKVHTYTEDVCLSEYKSILKSGMFWEFFPEYKGSWEKDKEQFMEFKNQR